MTTTINGITARLGRSAEDFRRYQITVQVNSKKRPGLKSTSDIDPGKANNYHHLLQMVGAAGAACAEYLGEKYGDDVDPTEASRDAIRAFGEECWLLVSLTKDAPTKLKRLESHAAKLRNPDRELLLKLRWAVDRGEILTPQEIAWVDLRIGEIHQGSL